MAITMDWGPSAGSYGTALFAAGKGQSERDQLKWLYELQAQLNKQQGDYASEQKRLALQETAGNRQYELGKSGQAQERELTLGQQSLQKELGLGSQAVQRELGLGSQAVQREQIAAQAAQAQAELQMRLQLAQLNVGTAREQMENQMRIAELQSQTQTGIAQLRNPQGSAYLQRLNEPGVWKNGEWRLNDELASSDEYFAPTIGWSHFR